MTTYTNANIKFSQSVLARNGLRMADLNYVVLKLLKLGPNLIANVNTKSISLLHRYNGHS